MSLLATIHGATAHHNLIEDDDGKLVFRMNLLASIHSATAHHELVEDDDGKIVYRTYTHDPDRDCVASDSEAEEFCDFARLCGGYVRRGVGMGGQQS